MLKKTGLIAIAMVFAVVGARSLNPRELYNQMYPVEALKRHAFNLCSEADPAFIRAMGSYREECYNSMPHIIAIALGRVHPGAALATAALTDASREAELLMTLAGMPPRQPITERRSFANTSWMRGLSPPCEDKGNLPSVAYSAPSGMPAPPATPRAGGLDSTIVGNLPALPRAAPAGVARRDGMPVVPLARNGGAPPLPAPGAPKGAVAEIKPLPAPDIGDNAPPAIVPVATASACGGA